MLIFNNCIPLPYWRRKMKKKTSLHKRGLKATSFVCFPFSLNYLYFIFKKKFSSSRMNFIDPEDNLVDFPEKFLNLRDELNLKHEASLVAPIYYASKNYIRRTKRLLGIKGPFYFLS